MKYAFAGLAIVALASAQQLSDIPSCALPCITDAVTSSTSCDVSDFACVCENQSTLTGAATPCVIEKCGADVGVNEVLPAVQKFCAEVEAGGSATTSSAETAPTSTSEVVVPSSSAAVYPTSSEAAPTTSTCTGVESTVTSFTTATATGGCGHCNGTVSTAYPTSTFVTAGAAHIAGPVGGIAALLLGALAAF